MFEDGVRTFEDGVRVFENGACRIEDGVCVFGDGGRAIGDGVRTIGDCARMIGDHVRMILIVDDPDHFFVRALQAGATEIFPVGEEYGWRLGRLSDPFGLH